MFYEPSVAYGYEWINCVNDADYEVFWGLDGTPRASDWRPVRVRRVRADHRQPFNPSDFPWLGAHALVMRRAAVDALGELLVASGEVLPLETDDGVELFVLNATRVVDALDEGRSEITRFPGSGRIMRIKSIAFKTELLRGIDIFRLPHRASATYVSDRVVKIVAAAGLRGLEFKNAGGEC